MLQQQLSYDDALLMETVITFASVGQGAITWHTVIRSVITHRSQAKPLKQ